MFFWSEFLKMYTQNLLTVKKAILAVLGLITFFCAYSKILIKVTFVCLLF